MATPTPPGPDGTSRLLPEGFLFGVATAGFQIEGGYNGPGQPANNWAAWERSGRADPSGGALDFWNRYEEQLDRVAGLGCDSFRLSVEWARVVPGEDEVDEAALARYRAILEACRDRGLTPLVTLQHFTHPAWLGTDLWLRPDSPARYVEWVTRAVDALGDLCRHWVTLNEMNILAVESYLIGTFPPGRRFDLGATLRAIDNLLTAHILGYQAIHRLQPGAVVATNNYALSVYELDRLPLDILAARAEGTLGGKLRPWLAERRAAYLARLPVPSSARSRAAEGAFRRLAQRRAPLEGAFPRAVSAAEAAVTDRLLDVAQVDYYDPVVSHHVRLPGHRTAGGRSWEPARLLWDDPPNPAGLVSYCAVNEQPGTAVWVVENGLCNRVTDGRSLPRIDGWDRPRYLREHLAAVVEAVRVGIPVGGYWHWTLADNYEWGSYEPRFGLYGVDRRAGTRWTERDSMGDDAAGCYRELIAGLRRGDGTVLAGPPGAVPR